MTEDDYREGLRGLMPPGPAFDPGLQPDVAQLLAGLAPELARVDQALDALQLEMNPATVDALLTDWEAYLGLPDACTVPGSQTVEQRRQAVIDKLTASGAPQVAYYKRRARQSGVVVTIDEFRPARVGPTVAGGFLYGGAWSWAWLASAPLAAYGTPQGAAMECRLRLEAPEYTDVEIGYGKAEAERIAAHVDQLFTAIHYVMPAAIAGLED
ncbi:putative phage tail protein [Pseudomonas cremoricolorata]|nr:putative phage tail protein [Pseudomonas cremoricolorata]